MSAPRRKKIELVDDPAEFDSFTAQQFVDRVQPLLRRAGLAHPPEAARRHEESVPLAVAELALEYRRKPEIDGRHVSFGEFLDVRLRQRLLELDQRQHPELYDRNRGYHPGEAAASLETLGDKTLTVVEEDPERSLAAEMAAAGIHPASQPGVLAYVAGVQTGLSPRQAAKALDAEHYKTRPATAAYFAALDLLDEMDERREPPPPSSSPRFGFTPNV